MSQEKQSNINELGGNSAKAQANLIDISRGNYFRDRTHEKQLKSFTGHEGAVGSGAIVLMGAGALSGFIVGTLVQGEFLLAVAVSVASVGAGWAGWWARGGL